MWFALWMLGITVGLFVVYWKLDKMIDKLFKDDLEGTDYGC
jgi:hypothetical protein